LNRIKQRSAPAARVGRTVAAKREYAVGRRGEIVLNAFEKSSSRPHQPERVRGRTPAGTHRSCGDQIRSLGKG
jgi:hypothetical protein